MMRWWCALAAVFLCAQSAWAATYYVRKDGSDSACNGLTDASSAAAPSCAFLTIQKGADAAVVAGDRVMIHAGTYFEVVSVRGSGLPSAYTTIQGVTGEKVVVDAGVQEFRRPGNNDWEIVDASIGEYRSVTPYAGARVYAYVDGIPGYENGRVGLVPYSDTRAESGGGLEGFRPFRATSDEYVDPVTPFYVGPGLWMGRQCVGGTMPGAACETSFDCGTSATCAPTNRIHIRLSKTADMRAAEARYGTVFGEENPDPRDYSIILSLASYTLRIYGSYLKFVNLTFNQSLRTVNLESGSHHIVFDGVTVWVGDSGIAADQAVNPPHHVKVTRSRIYGDSPYWIFWSDSKDAPYPALKMNGTDIHIANGSHDWEVYTSHIRGGMDGLSTNTNEYNIAVHHNRIENMKDDSLEIEGVVGVGRVAVFENYIGNCLNGFAPGQQSPSFTGPALYYRNVVSLLRDPPINRKAGINTFNGGFRFGHEYAFKQRSPNTFYYHNTVVLLNSHDKGMNIVPGVSGDQADTYVLNNIYVKVNRLVQGPYFTGPGQIVDNNLYWKVNTADTDPLLDVFETVPEFSAARGLELHGLGNLPRTGTNPGFKTWAPVFDTTVPGRWTLGPAQEVWNRFDFLLDPESPAIGAGRPLPTHPRFGVLPDSRSSADLGALPSTASAAESSQFPFNQKWSGPFSGPDLVTTTVSNPPASAVLGGIFTATDTVANQGLALAGASASRYFLSADPVRSGEDTPLVGDRTLPGLAAGSTSTGTASVTVSNSVAPGPYYLLACADATKAIQETQDTNNCLASAGRVLISAPDLVETSVSNPPASAAASTSLMVSDTATNQGTSVARVSTTRYYLSVDGAWDTSDRMLTGSRTVPTLAAGASSIANVTVTVPPSAPAGSYFLLACADDTGLMIESSEANNCGSSASQVQVLVKDLATTALSDPAGPVVAGNSASTFTMTDTVVNLGQLAAPATVSRYYLSGDAFKSGDDVRVSATRAVPALDPGASSAGMVTLTAPAGCAEGDYFVLACADDTALVVEGNEANNCRSSAATLRVTLPDLVETAISGPSAGVILGQGFAVTDSVSNQGTGLSKASTTRYYLSLDLVKSPEDLVLSRSRSIPGLAPGASSTGTVTQTLPAGTPLGTYQLLACADDASVVTEASETNNCRSAASPVSVAMPDLQVTALVDPPSVVTAMVEFSLEDSTTNSGTGAAVSSVTAFYLSGDSVKDAADVRLGSRSIPALAPGASSTGTTLVMAPLSAVGPSWYVLACADDPATLIEGDEANNCRVSAGGVTVWAPDLVLTAVSDPPAIAAAGSTFSATDTVLNSSTIAAGPSTTRYYLSVDTARDSVDALLNGSRSVPALAPGATSAGTITITIPSGMAIGSFYLLACADDVAVFNIESDETNNCAASIGTVRIENEDLLVTAVSDPPSTAVAGNGSYSFPITDTVVNQGQLAAVATTTRYYVSLDMLKDAADYRIGATRSVPALAAGGASSGTVTAIAPSAAPEGLYYIIACADGTALVSEGNEGNNCRASAGQVRVLVPDLVETTLTNQTYIQVGVSFPATETVLNQGSGPARNSTTRFYLSSDPVFDPLDVLLTGSRAVRGLTPTETTKGTTSVTVPAGTPAGPYWLLACADDASAMPEVSETNNCRPSLHLVQLLP